MATAKATLIGLYNLDSKLFDKMVLPDGIDKNLFISSLLLKGGEFEVLFFNPGFMEDSIGIWSNKWYRTFADWLKGTQQTWNPLHNYDRFETYTDTNNKTFGSKTTANYSDTRNADLTETRTADLQDQSTFANDDTTQQTEDATTTHSVAGYNSSSYTPSSQDKVNNGISVVSHSGSVTNTTTGTDTNATTGTDTNTTSGTLADTSGSDNTTIQHTAHLYGNIGVTTSAAMLKEFYDISSWNLYEHMADIFIQEFLIPVY